jgi:asparagine synthase (glutamine-hydrolysing)
MAMKSAIEQRVPFLDNEVLSLSNTIRRGDKVTMFDTKKILKDAFRKELPQFLFNQPKRGWFSPGAKWLRLPKIKKMAEEILSRDYYSGTENIFRWDELATTFQNHVSKEEYNVTILWVIMTFQVWAKHYQITE